MATLVNGARIESDGYEFGVKYPGDGEPHLFSSYREARKAADSVDGAQLKFRARYITSWMDATLWLILPGLRLLLIRHSNGCAR